MKKLNTKIMNKITPQWLKEVLDRGFKPKKIFYDFHDFAFGYVDVKAKSVKTIPRAYSLEGLPGSGKTSISSYFSNKKKILAVKQILPAEPKFDQAMAQLFFFHSDELKTKQCLNSDKICLLDRYYPSTLAFNWAYDKIHNSNAYGAVWNWYLNSLKKNKLIKPYTIILIETPIDLSLSRKNRSASIKTDDLWRNKKFLEFFRDYYNYFYKKIEPQTKLVKIDGTSSLDSITKKIKSILYEK